MAARYDLVIRGGTVADASPEREFGESESKAHAVMRAIELAGQQSDWE